MTSRAHIKAIIFDLDDTLIHWTPNEDAPAVETYRPYLADVLNAARKEHPPFDVSLDVLVDAFDVAVKESIQQARVAMVCTPIDEIIQTTFERLGLSLTDEAKSDLLRRCEWPVSPLESLEPSAELVLKRLRAKGLKLGIITNALLLGSMRANELVALGIRDYFDAVVTSGDVRRFKPHAEIFEFTLRQLECEASATMMVGDSLRDDARASTAAGLEGVWYSPSGHDHLGLIPTDKEPVIRDLTDLLDMLDC